MMDLSPANPCKRTCPLCNCEQSQVLYKQRFENVEGAGFLSGYDVAVCVACGFAFADNIPRQEAIDAYYSQLSKYESPQEAPHDDARFTRVVRNVESTGVPKAARILDIGCSTGRLLHMLRAAGYPDVTGLDPSPVCAQVAQERYGVTVLTQSVFDVRLPSQFDLVILLGVLEHIHNLSDILSLLRVLLSDNGLAYVAVPDATRFADFPDAPYQQFSIEHINFFSALSLRNAMATAGFSVLLDQQITEDQSDTAVVPTIHGVYKKTPAIERELVPDVGTRKAIPAYVARSQRTDVFLHKQINALADAQIPILVWGVGTHTQRLLLTSRLAEANIMAFVDSNRHVQGSLVRGIPVIAPEAVQGRSEGILISSWVCMRDIERDIREKYHYTNEMITLYE